jgi:hypothetical protein
MSVIILAAAVLFCWHPSDYGTKNPPTCALSYEACQQLVSDHGGSCRSQ